MPIDFSKRYEISNFIFSLNFIAYSVCNRFFNDANTSILVFGLCVGNLVFVLTNFIQLIKDKEHRKKWIFSYLVSLVLNLVLSLLSFSISKG